MEFKVRVETEMINQEMKRDLGKDVFLNLQKKVPNSLKQSLRRKTVSLHRDSILWQQLDGLKINISKQK